jgi:3-oxoacyl-[acyl-carrier-protein] synthase-3
MRAVFSNVRLAGVVGVVPRNVSYFDDELANYSHDPANSRKLKQAMGYGEHRIATKGTTTSDLACFGLVKLFSEYGVNAQDIDAIFFVSQTPDYVLPATSAYIHGQFDFSKETYCVDINDGCCGYVKGLYEAAAFLQVTAAKRVLLIAGDVLSPRVSIHDRNSYPLIGDAATVTLLEKTVEASPLDIEIYYNGTGYDKLIIPAGGARSPGVETRARLETDEDGNKRSAEDLRMSGTDVFAFTQTVVPDFITSFLDRRALTPEGIDLFLLHQANAFILERIRMKLAVSKDKIPDQVIRKYGNSSSGTIPMSLACAHPAPGANVMACGFGVGLSWGAAMFKLEGLDFCAVVEY